MGQIDLFNVMFKMILNNINKLAIKTWTLMTTFTDSSYSYNFVPYTIRDHNS